MKRLRTVAAAGSTLCSATRRDGEPCRARSTRDGLCMAHSPTLREKAQEARRAGGYNSARAVRLARLCPPRLVKTFDLLEQVLDELHKGTLPPQVGSAMAAVAGQMARILVAGEIEERLRKLEAASPQTSGNGRRWR